MIGHAWTRVEEMGRRECIKGLIYKLQWAGPGDGWDRDASKQEEPRVTARASSTGWAKVPPLRQAADEINQCWLGSRPGIGLG